MSEMQFDWTVHPDAEKLVDRLVSEASSTRLESFVEDLRTTTSTRLVDWLDHVAGNVDSTELEAAGFVDQAGVWRHPAAQLPAIVNTGRRGVALRVDDAATFASAHGGDRVDGSKWSGFRRAVISHDDPVFIAGVERRSWSRGIEPEGFDERQIVAAVHARSIWELRAKDMDQALTSARTMVDLVGADLAASYVLELERQYWQRRNRAAVLQHGRQDRLGLGWGNNDHHTFRSSRATFRGLIEVFTTLGFVPRERFYAGEEAGWGAQVLEHPGCGGVIFADVDLTPEEVAIDFASAELAPIDRLGTVGLWCALHGESILGAGMHHLEGQFEFDQLRDDLSGLGVAQMKPFSDFPHLRQAFTEAERWPVSEDRLESLVNAGQLDEKTAQEFRAHGAPGSHLENLARRGGFKGFNQANVSVTMAATDPRHYRPV